MNQTGGSLTIQGREQARGLGERLRTEKVAGVVSSELARAVQTAEIAAAVLGLQVRVRERLHEFPPGDGLGHPPDQALTSALARSWVDGDLAVGMPGGETGRE